MRIRADRPRIDRHDFEYLLEKVDIKDENQAINLYEWCFPDDALRVSALEVRRSVLKDRFEFDSPEGSDLRNW